MYGYLRVAPDSVDCPAPWVSSIPLAPYQSSNSYLWFHESDALMAIMRRQTARPAGQTRLR